MKSQKRSLFLAALIFFHSIQSAMLPPLAARLAMRSQVAQSLKLSMPQVRNMSESAFSRFLAKSKDLATQAQQVSSERYKQACDAGSRWVNSLKSEQNVDKTYINYSAFGKRPHHSTVAGQAQAELKDVVGHFNKSTAETHVHGPSYHGPVTINNNYGSTGFWDVVKTSGDKAKIALGMMFGWTAHSVLGQEKVVVHETK
ncbi:hypothetical protein KBC04_04530 [Candidatus Babeliales bacterium]|nr:hypothetical protein [Candidatus Babeliales bacterium]MBP9844087.1 hypothetical protein [Candidatus Babeliales bacterium]